MGPGGHNGLTLSTDAVSKHGHDARRVGRVPTLDRYQINSGDVSLIESWACFKSTLCRFNELL